MSFTVFLTVFSGVSIYVLGQLALKLVIDPVHETKRTIAEISYWLNEYENVNPGVSEKERMDEASQRFRKLSAQLRSHLSMVLWYDVVARILGLPARNKILTASVLLRGLANSVTAVTESIHEQIAKRREKICDLLGIDVLQDERWPKDSS